MFIKFDLKKGNYIISKNNALPQSVEFYIIAGLSTRLS